ncbi:MAG: hypothetical protein ACE5HO_11295 [bacterium]
MLYFTQQLTSYGIDFSSLGFLLTGAKDDANVASAFQVVGRDIWKITGYNLSLWLFAAALGHGFRMLVRSLRLDLKYDLLRFNNEWYYFMSGEIIAKDIDFVWIDALVQTSEGSIIYSGLLQDFYLSKDGGLERIYLTQVARRKLSNEAVDKPSESEQEGTPRYYDVPGDLFVIKYSQVVNLNLNYFSTVE